MIAVELLKELRRIAGPQQVLTGRIGEEVYSYDASLAGGVPGAVVFPGSAAEAAAIVRALAQAAVPCIPRGFGTNLSGGSVAVQGGVVLCLSRLNRILEIKPERRCARVQCGVTNLEVQQALAPLGFYFAPDPASQKAATLGGNVGENSGGPHCLKYGVTTNHVLGLELVLPDGELMRVGGTAFDPPGYDLRGLFIGSEGTFGAATEITVRILPKPEAVVTLLAIYDSVADAARSVSEIIARGILPATLEMMDAAVIRAVEDSLPCGYPRDAAAVLIIEVEGPAAGLREQAGQIKDACAAKGCRAIREAKDADERNLLWAGRRGAFGAIARLAPNFHVADCTVPRTRLPEALAQVQALSEKYGFMTGNVFHAGDGNLHPLLLFDARDPAQLHKVHEAAQEITAACVKLGGTITGEHGVGVEKLEAMRLIFSEDDLAFQRSVRQAFDPRGLFNPGKVLPSPPLKKGGPGGVIELAQNTPPYPPFLRGGETVAELIPADSSEACEMVLAAIAEKKALLPLGGGRRADFGNASDQPVIPLFSRKLSGLSDYDPANQVLVCGAGMKLTAAQSALSANRQWLPLRPPLANGCTLGGLVALGACGPERAAHGAPRDRLLGLRFVSGLGRQIKTGGRVMKNVAGYDVTRLLAGSAGTLGFLTEFNFRVAAAPETCRSVRATGTLPQCAAAAAKLLASNLEPVFVTAAPAAEGRTWHFQAGFEGFEITTRAQSQWCKELLHKAGLQALEEVGYPLLEGAHAGDFERIWGQAFVLRVDLPLDKLAEFSPPLEKGGPGGVKNGNKDTPPYPPFLRGGEPVLLDFACGRLSAGLAVLADEDWEGLCRRANQAEGHAILEKAPLSFKRRQDVFGPPRREWELMRRIKETLDPHGIFAPGRLAGTRENKKLMI